MNTGTVETFEPKTRFNLIPFDKIRVNIGRDYLVKGLIPRTGLAVAWGPPQSGKSFWAFDVAMHIALGWEYRGHRTQQAPVVYVAGEGQGGFNRRVEAFRSEKMIENADPAPFHLLGEPLDLIGEHQELVQDIRAQTDTVPGLVVLDTLNRTLRGDENSPEDMGRYVAAADTIRDAFGCCVLVVHHCGHEQSRPRGHTALTAAADAQFGVTQTGETRTIEVDKQKDGPTGERLSFTLRSVEVAEDEDGDTITSCVVEPTEAPAADHSGAPRLSERQRAMLNVLHEEGGAAGLTTDEWNAAARDAGIKASRQSIYNTRIALKDRRLVHQDQLGKWHLTTR